MNTYFAGNKKKIFYIIAILIFSVGVFLRTYHFRDWLQFGPDQVRDISANQNIIEGRAPWPLLGPEIGNIKYNLGPIYYYFQILSGKIFGVLPETMAYPDLLFSILTIPLFYFFLKKYFTPDLSLTLTGLFSISLFIVEYSRFASNPNPSPFFNLLFLYSLLEILSARTEKKYLWAALAGISLGVIIQLHVFFLLVMPVIAGIAFVYLLFKKSLDWKVVLIIAFLTIFLNMPQIISEIKTGGENIHGMFSVTEERGTQVTKQSSLLSAVGTVVSCQLEYNVFMISSLERQDSERCEDIFTLGENAKKYTSSKIGNAGLSIAIIVGCLLFSIGGYILLGYYWWKEESDEKKRFLSILFLLNIISLLAFIPGVSQFVMRYCEILIFIPFVLLGLWIKILWEKTGSYRWIVVLPLIGMLIFLNLFIIARAATPFMEKRASNENNAILGEMEEMADYIASQSQPHQTIYISGDRICQRRFLGSMDYLLQESGVNALIPKKDEEFFDQATPFFYLTGRKISGRWQNKIIDGRSLAGFKTFHNGISVLVLKPVAGQ